MALLLWFSAYIEARHLGPVVPGADEQDRQVPAEVVAMDGPVITAVDPLGSAA